MNNNSVFSAADIINGAVHQYGNIGYQKKKVALGDILAKANNIQAHCRDVVQDLNGMEFHANPYIVLDNVGKNLFSDGEEVCLTRWSMGQLLSRYGIPVPYAARCIARRHSDLLEENVNTWLLEDSSKAVLRLYDAGAIHTVRGIVSEKYSAFDAPEIVSSLMQNHELMTDFAPRNWFVTPERMQIRLVQNEQFMDEEDLYLGIIAESSDVGMMSVNVRLFVYKQICTNGLVIPFAGITYRQIHMGQSAEGFSDDVSSVLRALPDFRKAATEVIRASKGNTKLWFDPEDEVSAAAFAKTHGFLLGVVKAAVAILKDGKYGKPNRWAFINALTDAAQQLNVDARNDTERAAGRLLIETKHEPADTSFDSNSAA